MPARYVIAPEQSAQAHDSSGGLHEIVCPPVQIVAVEAALEYESGAAAKFQAQKAAGVVGVGAKQLDANNFESEIAGKGAFIKFLAPW